MAETSGFLKYFSAAAATLLLTTEALFTEGQHGVTTGLKGPYSYCRQVRSGVRVEYDIDTILVVGNWFFPPD